MQAKRHVAPLVVVALLFFSTFAQAETLHVPKQYARIQACIDAAAKGDECVVAPGTYNEAIDFLGKAITLRSSDGADVTIIDGTGLNSSVVKCVSGEGPKTVLDGFTITGGNATGSYPDDVGGGMLNIGSRPTVTNCTFDGNQSTADGGGMYNFDSSPTVANCTFSGNDAASGFGGGMYNSLSNPTLTNCTLHWNTAFAGGGMYNNQGSPRVTNCTFSENEAASEGGAVYNSDSSPTIGNCAFIDNVAVFGGAMANRGDSSPLISHCRFQENFAHRFAGAMFNFFQNGALVHVVDSEFLDNHAELNGGAVTNDRNMPLFNRCIFRGNSSGGNAGAVANFDVLEALFMNCVFNSNVAGGSGSAIENSDSDPLIVNCTFTGNRAGNDGAVWNIFESRPALWNCILWNNSDRSGMIEASQITDALDGNAAINHSCVQGLTGSLGGEGNIGTDPRFVSRLGKDGLAGTEDDDLRLLAGSPAIDAGDHEFVPEGITTDLDGNPRFVDDPAAPDTGVGDAPIVDMGAYEFQVDCDGNGLDDDEEIAADPTLDCDANGKLDACDDNRDRDGDGVIDDCDECSDSSADETIVINGCETRVVNQVFNDGCTMADDLAACGEEVRNHGAYVSCVARVANSWQRDGMISDGEHGRVVSCAAKQHTGRNLGGAAHWKKEPDPQK